MVLGLADIGATAAIVGLLAVPLYMLFNSLSRSYSKINRGIGELKKDVGKNTGTIKEMKSSVDKLMQTWSNWVKK